MSTKVRLSPSPAPKAHLLKVQTIRPHLDIRVDNDSIRMMWKAH